jgi:hypothetical protein
MKLAGLNMLNGEIIGDLQKAIAVDGYMING